MTSPKQTCQGCGNRTRSSTRLCPTCRSDHALPEGQWRPVGPYRTLHYFPKGAA